MYKKQKNFLRAGFLMIAVLCVVVFWIMAALLSRNSSKTITDISEFYMMEVNSQVQEKFSLVLELTMEKMDGVINRNPPETTVYGEEMLESLATSARVRNFTYLGFLTEDGELETVYGNDMIVDSKGIVAGLAEDKIIAETGVDSKGGKCLLLGHSVKYPLADGGKSVAMVAGISAEYLSGVLFAETDDEVIYTHIINENGDYVIRNSLPGTTSGNYLEYIRTEMKGIGPKEAERYAKELESAIQEKKDYAFEINVYGESRRAYCVPLHENSTWYLVTVMPGGFLDDSITALDHERIALMIGVSLFLLLIISMMFMKYYRFLLSQMEQLDIAKREADKANQFKSAFLSSMSHDIRTPMNAIMGMSEIALHNQKDPARVKDCLEKIRLSGSHLLGLINDILDLSKIESGKMTLHAEELSLRKITADIVTIIYPQTKERKQRFDIIAEKILSENIWCDSIRLNQVLLNLLSNAIKFTPEGGRIEVRLSQGESVRGAEYVSTHFQVSDTGIGMSAEFLERIFDSFEREDREQVHHTTGSGLGMSIAKRIVDMMGGSIEVESEEGKGTRFDVVVDFKRASEPEEERLPAWRALIFGAEEAGCEWAASELEKMGLYAEWVREPEMAVQIMRDNSTGKKGYPFILLDWDMPDKAAMRIIEEINGRGETENPAFLIAARDMGDIENEIPLEKGWKFLQKPLFHSTLYDCLSECAGSPEGKGNKETEEIDLRGKHILLAEDNDLNWEIANEILSGFGLDVERAENGKVCVDKFNVSAIRFYDAILMDVHMPVMDGYEATRLIRSSQREDKSIPVIAMTADAFSDDVRHCLDCGMNFHLSKPLDFQECLKVLRKYVGNNP